MNLNVTTPTIQSLEQTLARFATGPIARQESELAFQVLKLSLLDWLSVGVGGIGEPVSEIVRSAAIRDGGAGDAGVFGSEERVPARSAALVNGATSHALDYDDTHFAYLGHPSAAVLPAALAMTERTNASATQFLEAALIGVETACRVGQWMGRPHYEAGFHQTATSGTFGATAACARLLGLDENRTSHALGLASTKASGLKSQFGTMGKPYHAGLAASNGVEAALLAEAGFVSNPEGLTGSQGFGETHGQSGGTDAVSLANIGKQFIFSSVQHKFHACCHGTHAMLEALGRLKLEHELGLVDVEALTVTVHPRFLKVCNLPDPQSGLEAKFSYRQTAGMCLSNIDTSALASFTDEICSEPKLAAFRERVSVETDPELLDAETRIAIVTKSGETLDAYHDIDSELPMADRERKVRTKSAALLGNQRADAVWQRIGNLEGSASSVSLAWLLNG